MKNKGKSGPNEAKNSFARDKKCPKKEIIEEFGSV